MLLYRPFIAAMSNSRLLAELEARERTDAERWQKAGMGRAPRTFAYDVTKSESSRKPTINVRGVVVSDDKKEA